MDKSLEDIIKTRFSGKKQQNGVRKSILKKPKQQANQQKKRQFHQNKPQQPPPIQDARLIIARSKRAKVSDARVILAKKARRVQRDQPPVRRNAPPVRKHRVSLSDIDDDMLDLDLTPPVLRRTVKNDIRPPPAMPPLPTFGRDRAMSDPFDCYEPYERPAFIPKAPPAPIINLEDPYYTERSPRKGILRKNSPQPASSAIKSRLYAAPDPRQPSGLFARDRDPDLKDAANGFRIVVSNLHNTVTQSDIQELFEDIGELIEARLVRPGVAEVIYARQHDAEIAVETYHNRQLDGQPMKCLLVRKTAVLPATITPAQRYINKNVELDLDTLHKVLFNR